MSEPVVFKRSLPIAFLTVLQTLAPAIVAIGMLAGIAHAYGVAFGSHFMMLSVLLAILSPVIMKPPQLTTLRLPMGKWSIVASLVARWLFMLAVLLAIGYVTKFSEDFSRRVVLTWAVVTPVPIILALLAVNGAMQRLMYSRSNVRTAVFAGYSEASVALAGRLKAEPRNQHRGGRILR